MEDKISPFSHRWTLPNLDWFCKHVQGHPKFETKVNYNDVSTPNEPNKWITLELFPNGFDHESSNYISLRIWADKYIFFRLWIESDSHENVLKVENSNKLSTKIEIKNYYIKTDVFKNFNFQNETYFSINVEGIIVNNENFNVLQNLNLVNELIEKTNVTNDLFDYMQSIHLVGEFNWTIEKFETSIENGTTKFDKVFKFAKNINFKTILEKTNDSPWKLFIELLTPNSSQFFMWFRLKTNDDNKNNNINNYEHQVKILNNFNKMLEFQSMTMEKLLANKQKYFSNENLELTFEAIRLKNSIYKFYHVQESKLNEFVMKRFVIFNYINFDSFQHFVENNLKKEVTREELVNSFLYNTKKREKVFEILKDVFVGLDLENAVKNKSQTYINIQNVFLSKDSTINCRDVSMNSSATIPTETVKLFEKLFKNYFDKFLEEINSLKDFIEKKLTIKQNNFCINDNGVQVIMNVVKKETDKNNFEKMLNCFVKVLMPFITDENVIEKMKNKGEKIESFKSENSEIINVDINQSNLNNNKNYQNEFAAKASKTISSVSVPMNNSDLVYYWAMTFACGNFETLRKIPWQKFQNISIQAKSIIDEYNKQDKLMKTIYCNQTIDVAKLIIKQINELADNAKEDDQLFRFITIEDLNKSFKH